MPGVDWRFPAILVIAMALSLAMSYLQMRAYNVQLNRGLRAADGEHLMLVSGRGRSMRGGAVVIAIVDVISREIVWARAMTGVTIFARFRDVPALLGPLADAADRVRGKQFQAAVQMAIQQLKPAHPDADESSGQSGEPRRLVRGRPTNTPQANTATGTAVPQPQPTKKRKN